MKTAGKRKGLYVFAWALLVIVVAFAVLPIGVLAIFTALGPLLDLALDRLTVALTTTWLGELGTFYIALLFGVIAYGLREWARPAYALAEIFFGAYGGGVALGFLYRPDLLPPAFKALTPLSASMTYSQYVGLASAIYVMVRGVDNMTIWVKNQAAKAAKLREDNRPSRG